MQNNTTHHVTADTKFVLHRGKIDPRDPDSIGESEKTLHSFAAISSQGDILISNEEGCLQLAYGNLPQFSQQKRGRTILVKIKIKKTSNYFLLNYLN